MLSASVLLMKNGIIPFCAVVLSQSCSAHFYLVYDAQALVEAGLTFIDTAEVYGFGTARGWGLT